MKHRYAKVTRNFVVYFCLFSMFVVVVNIIGLSRHGYISIPNFFIVLSSFFGSLLTTIYLLSGYRQFDLKKHRKLIKKFKSTPESNLPSVDVFLPCAGEELNTLKRTYRAVDRIAYPKDKINVYVLDDKGSDEVKSLTEEFDFHYLSRPNKGENKKAGNLKYGFEHSSGKYILILDADFAPKPEAIFELLLYPEEDKKIGICQSPQDFIPNKKEPLYIQKGDVGIQEFFYRICQVARNSFNATVCTGTNALYRRLALKKAGGFYQIEHSEDSHTGINLVKHGYKVFYLPVILAVGYCPSNYHTLYKQRSRWCQGSLTLSKSKLFRETKLSPMALLCYFSGFYYYLNSFIILSLPFHTLYLLSTPQKSTLIDNLFFLPNVIYLIMSFTIFYYPRFSLSVLGNQFFFYWTYLFVTIKLFVLGKKEGWTPTGATQRKNMSYKSLLMVVFAYISIYWLWFTSIITRSSYNFVLSDSLLFFWITYNISTHLSFVAGLVVPVMHKHKITKKVKRAVLAGLGAFGFGKNGRRLDFRLS